MPTSLESEIPFLMSAAAAAAKSLQPCPILCGPTDGRPPGSAVPGILQARTLEWNNIQLPVAKIQKQPKCPSTDEQIKKIRYIDIHGLPGGTFKEPACQCRGCKRWGFETWAGKIPCRRTWKPTLIFLPGESHGQRSLMGSSSWGHKESDTTEVT